MGRSTRTARKIRSSSVTFAAARARYDGAVKRLVCLLLVAAACSDPPPPVDVSNGRLTARIYPDPARIVLVLDGEEVWSTRGDSSDREGAPDGFAAIGT